MCNSTLMAVAGIAAIALTWGAATPVVAGSEAAGAAAAGAAGTAGTAAAGSTAAYTAAEAAALGAGQAAAAGTAAAGITGQTLLTGMSLAGTGLSAYGALENGKLQKEIGNRNADAAKMSADEVLRRGVAQADVVAGRGRQAAGTQAAIMGATNVDSNSGIMSTVRDATAVGTNLEAQYALDRALNQAWSLENQATNDRFMGEATNAASKVSAFDTILTGGRRAYGVYKGYKDPAYGYNGAA